MGRTIIPDFWRVFTQTGLIINNNGNPLDKGALIDHIELLRTLMEADPGILNGTIVIDHYKGILEEIEVCLDARVRPLQNCNMPLFDVEEEVIDGNELQFTCLNVADDTGKQYRLRLVDGTIFENFSRAIQLLYLHNNGIENHYLLNLEGKASEIEYRSIYHLVDRMIDCEYSEKLKWTILLCTIALLCSNPGPAICCLHTILQSNPHISLDEFINRLKGYSLFRYELDLASVDDFYSQMRLVAQHLNISDRKVLQKYLSHISNMVNFLRGNLMFFAHSTMDTDMLQNWIREFGCPDIVLQEDILQRPWGITTDDTWLNYYYHGHRLLYRTT